MRQLDDYSRTTTLWHHLAVIVLFPVPSIIASFAAPLVPLQDPSKGFYENRQGFLILTVVTIMLVISSSLPQICATAGISHKVYSKMDILLVAVVTTAPITGLTFLLATYWRFPVPFFWVVISGPLTIVLALSNAFVLRRHLRRVGPRLQAYGSSFAVQYAQILVYPAYSTLFEAVGSTAQLVLILFFPILKFVFKKLIFALTRPMNIEFTNVISVSSVEICASMYQSIIMQTTPSPYTTALLIGIDVVQGCYEVWKFKSCVTALLNVDPSFTLARIVSESHRIAQHDDDLRRFGRFGTKQAIILAAELIHTSDE